MAEDGEVVVGEVVVVVVVEDEVGDSGLTVNPPISTSHEV